MTVALRARFAFCGLLSALALGCSDQGGVAENSGASGTSTAGAISGRASGSASSGGNGASGAGSASAPLGGESGSPAQAAGGGGVGIGGSGAAASGGVASSGGAAAGAGPGGNASGGASAATPSPGCGMAASQALGSWVEQPTLSVKAKARQWWIWLPTGYDPMRAYPVVFTFHGCGGPDNFPPMQKATGADAIVVRGSGSASGGCWTYGGTSDDVLFFDAMLAELTAKRCVDTSRIFLTGYSSGSWFTNTLECVRGDKLRATGTVSGGVVGNRGTCVGKYARIFVHDTDDTTNYFIKNGDTTKDGNYVERARLLAQNHCDAVTPPVPEDPAPCVRYQGCDAGYPVLMCQTMGKQHDRQDNLAPAAFWKLFSSL
jgi:polyhydroxybutyrate depolymerase